MGIKFKKKMIISALNGADNNIHIRYTLLYDVCYYNKYLLVRLSHAFYINYKLPSR